MVSEEQSKTTTQALSHVAVPALFLLNGRKGLYVPGYVRGCGDFGGRNCEFMTFKRHKRLKRDKIYP